MQIVVLSGSEADPILRDIIGQEPGSPAAIADLLRYEISSRGRCPRHFAISRVCRLVAPAITLDPAKVEEVCGDLERQGDVLLADGGFLHPAPLRVLDLGDGVFRFVGTIPTRDLVAAAPGEWSHRGVVRDCRLTKPITDLVAALGGIVLTPAAWAGLETFPIADADFVRWLDERLKAAPEAAGSLERDEPLRWTTCEVVSGAARWRGEGQVSGPAKLWRARHRWRGWLHAWTAGGPPSEQPFVTLHSDDGTRAVYALAVAAGTLLRASVERRHEDAVVGIPGWLPLAEYRYLSTCAERVAADAPGSCWAVLLSRFDAVCETLTSRLGLRFDEEPRP